MVTVASGMGLLVMASTMCASTEGACAPANGARSVAAKISRMKVARRNGLVSLGVRLRVTKELFKGAAVSGVGDGYSVDGERGVAWVSELAIVSKSGKVACLGGRLLKGRVDDAVRPGEKCNVGAKPLVELFPRAGELHAEELSVVSGGAVGPLFIEIWMPISVRFDIDQAGGVHLLKLFPRERIRGIRDGGWIDKEGDGDAAPFDDGIEHRVDRNMAVVDGDCDDRRRRRLGFAEDDIGNAGEGKDGVVMIGEEVELGLKGGGCYGG